MSKLTFNEWSILSDIQTITPLSEDYEFSMARGELKTAQAAITRLMTKLKGEGDLEAWVQSKITKASEYLDTVADQLSYGEDDTERKSDVKEELQSAKAREKAEQILRRGEGRPDQFYKNHDIKRLLGKTKKHPSQGYGLVDRGVLKRGQSRAPKHTHLQKGQNKELGVKSFSGSYGGVGTHGMPQKDTLPRGKGSKAARRAANLKKEEFEQILEGFKGHKSVEEIAKKHKVSPSVIQKQLEMGMKVEYEHTTDNDEAMDIALQHLDEIPNYYSKLKKMEKVKENVEILDVKGNLFATVIDIIKGSDDKFKGFTQPITEDAVKELENGLKKLDNTSYDSIDKLMRDIMKEHDMTAKELHNAFVKKHDKTPDDWVNELNEKCWDGYKQVGMKKEENKSGDSSLRDWFSKSRSSDGTPGWVQLGGKYAGKPCAKQPGQTTKPKCGSSKMKADLSDKEEESAFRRKNQEDPNPDRKGKAKMVATEEKDACYSKVKSRYSVWPSAYASGALVRCRKVGAKNWGNKTKKNVGEGVTSDALAYEWDTDIRDGQQYPLLPTKHRYCPKCKKNETKEECRYGPKYWSLFSLPPTLSSDSYDPNDIHPANESLSLKVGSFYKKPIDSIIQPGQLTNEDYQRIQSTGNVYTILFSWRGRPMMNIQLFFPNMKRPSKDEVKEQIEKLYPGAVIMQWHPSPTDPSKPIVVIQSK
jgi:hypothetical protein